jgi:glutaredoxin
MERAQITLYGRPGCELCVRAEEIVRALLTEEGASRSLTVVNIEDDPKIHARLMDQIPTLEIDGRLLPLAVSQMQIAAFLQNERGQVNGKR